MTKIAPSILAADFLNLKTDLKKAEKANADLFHLDIMDGHFVPNISFGPNIVKFVQKNTKLPLDVHLMISEPEFYLKKFISIGINYLSWHIEVPANHQRIIKKLKQNKIKAGLAINPETDWEKVKPFLKKIDFILIMTVHPGFGGQKYIKYCTKKIRELNKFRHEKKLNFLIQVDGGIDYQTAPGAKKAGADILVSGSFIFKSKNYSTTIKKLKTI